MSTPKRGMVAGGPITTANAQEDRKAFEEGYERTFGKDKKPQRGRFRYDEALGKCVPIDADWTDRERKAPHITEGIAYSNLTATDGTVIDSRRKHREYMESHGLSMASDFKEHWKTAEKQREEVLSGRADRKERREMIGRALHESKSKPRR